jgi:hypothetical protein
MFWRGQWIARDKRDSVDRTHQLPNGRQLGSYGRSRAGSGKPTYQELVAFRLSACSIEYRLRGVENATQLADENSGNPHVRRNPFARCFGIQGMEKRLATRTAAVAQRSRSHIHFHDYSKLVRDSDFTFVRHTLSNLDRAVSSFGANWNNPGISSERRVKN